MLTSIRMYVSEKLDEGGKIVLNEKQHHYLLHVMRCKVGDKLTLFNGKSGEWMGEVFNLNKKSPSLKILKQVSSHQDEADLWLVFALLKRGPMDLICEKASELGVAQLCPVITARTNTVRVSIERLKSITIEAAEQCGRMTIPKIISPQKLYNLLENWPQGRGLIVLDETGAGEPIANLMEKRPSSKEAILIGPEGGFEVEELKTINNFPFVASATLGKRMVRAETAAIAALSIWQALSGDWKRR